MKTNNQNNHNQE